MPELLENQYRDYLAKHLDLIEVGLTLVDTELKLPNNMGAKGFVDIVARDNHGLIVLVELKRSDSAARSAIHELFKYATLFRKTFGLGVHQFRCILLSTTWHELAVPYAEFKNAAPFAVEGKKLTIDSDGNPAGTSPTPAIDLSEAITICPKHAILLYSTARARDRDRQCIDEALEELKIDDHFSFSLDEFRNNPKVIHPFATYLVLGELSLEQRRHIERHDSPANQDAIEDPECEDEYSMDAESWEHEETVFSRVFTQCKPTSVEIGYPDKLRVILDSWTVTGYSSSGRFDSSLIWPEDSLLSAALSEGGEHTNYFTYQTSTSNPFTRERLHTKLPYALLGAGQWEESVPTLIRSLLSDENVSAVSVKIYSPCDILLGIAALHESRIDYLPSLEIIADTRIGNTRIFAGFPTWDRETLATTRQVLQLALPDGVMAYRWAQNFGEQWQDERRLCELHGFSYSLFEVPLDPSGPLSQIYISNDGMKCTQISIAEARRGHPVAFAMTHGEYVTELYNEIHKFAIGSPFQPTRDDFAAPRDDG
ncbi:endonuclease NucS domain-containing protein [Brachybacterium paraconglomeratum]|uniref:endonuclease NucS domain-containing protein n=1 Tax=Brachybacterium paraconglomeratum TaxID=173362 RepID=UPI00026C6A32|nr:endonuclease NucS domain-containing protein [Brachybacterium paraconglomeratum]